MPLTAPAPPLRRLILAFVLVALVAAPSAQAATGNIFTVVGDGTSGGGGDGGPASAAEIALPTDITGLSDGGYLLVDQGTSSVRRVSAGGIITTVAGNGTEGFAGDSGPATSAELDAPNAAVMLPDGRILIADSNNNRIRQVGLDGNISTVAGTGVAGYNGDNIPATTAQLRFPSGLAVLPDGSYLIADHDNHRVRRVDAAGTITTVAGTGTAGFSGDAGPAGSAQVNGPATVSTTADGGYLIAESNGFRIRKVDAGGTISTVAGTGVAGATGDGGPATAATIGAAGLNLTVDTMPDGGYVIADPGNQRVRRVLPDGTITTLAGTGTAGYNGDNIAAGQAQLNSPYGVGVNAEGDVLIADGQNRRVRSVDIADPAPPPSNPPTTVTLAPKTATRTPGDAPGVTATLKLRDGSPAPSGTPLRYAITGVNAVSGLFNLGATGSAAVPWDGVQDGADSVRVWVDQNGNGRFDFGEPADTATVNWVLPPPKVAKTVNIEPVKGKVFVKLPKKKGRVGAAQASGFIPLDEAKNVPVGTVVDTTQGTVELTSAATVNKNGPTQTSQFFQGDFQIQQTKTARPVTELVLNGALTCKSGSSRVQSSRARSRQLWGHGKGRFRTRGRNSTASVRGTYWLTKDSCNSTLTVVREGVVTVHDFAKNKDVKVKAGHRYVAHAKKKKKEK